MQEIQTVSSLTKEQKEAIGLLSVGTFLEYFDLMLYVHMAVLLNELFFPASDPHTTSLITALSFCSTFVFRPVGALIFGYIGDNVGRRTTVVITTFMMACSCLLMANLPTYEQIGITAAWLVTLCRIVQGMSSMGEITGAELYLTESIKPPIQYPVVSLVAVFATVGTMAALGVATLVTSYGFNWRLAFWFGTCIALIGTIARTALRETPEFTNAKMQITRIFEDTGIDKSVYEANNIYQRKSNKKTSISYFAIQCAWPACFYIAYVHCGNLYSELFGYSADQIIHNNFIVSIIQFLSCLVLTYLSSKIYPLQINRIRVIIFMIFIIACPFLLNNIKSEIQLLLLQSFIVVFGPDNSPASPIFYKYFSVLKRFTSVCFIYALSRALMYVIVSFGLIYLIKYFGNIGLLIIMLPITLGYFLGLRHFESLEREAGNYP
jgi:MFS family permease